MNKGLSLEDALKGVSPPKLTKEEWDAMHEGSLLIDHSARERTKFLTQWILTVRSGRIRE